MTAFKAGRVVAPLNFAAAGFDSGQAHIEVLKECEEDTDGVGTTADASRDFVGQATFFFENLAAALLADHAVEVAHHHRKGMRTESRADNVVSGAHVGNPVAHSLVDRFFKRSLASGHTAHFRTTEAHTIDIERLTSHVLLAHVDDTFEAHLGAHRGSSDTMLPGTGLGDDTFLTHPLRQEGLAESVVDLMCAGMEKVFALQIDFGPAAVLRQTVSIVQIGRAAGELAKLVIQLFLKFRVFTRRVIGLGQLEERSH